MTDNDISVELRDSVGAAYAAGGALCISGGGSKAFYGRAVHGTALAVGDHRGIVRYEPTELVITARAGTRLVEIEQTLDQHGQMLAFEPPHYGDSATLGGTIACNLSGPRRASAGAARDFVLGSRILNGRGEILSFGGEVMKNVAGYDVSRLMCGALGTLGVLLEVSLKVLPRPETETTLSLELDALYALTRLHDWARQPLPVSASCHDGSNLYVRLSGARGAVEAARKLIGGDVIAEGGQFWRRLREQQSGFFVAQQPLWRLALASDTPPLPLEGKWLYEWGGALRWLVSGAAPERIRAAAEAAGGHAVLYRGGDRTGAVFHPLPAALMAVHRKLKQAFDPGGILNPGRMYPDL
ncbi:MAG: glycolate oxidase subunit GlcE [Gammaproteobacteria bacterium]|jgi:glycolate oxidase FAD binding subunit